MAAIELITSRQTTRELGGKRTGEMVFMVDAPSDVALDDPGLPKEGITTFISDPNLLCDRRSASPFDESDSRSRVVCYFSSDRSWRAAPHIDKLQPGYVEFECDFLDNPDEIPVQIFTPKGLHYTRILPGGTTVEKTIDTWDLQRINALNYITAFQVQVVLQSFSITEAAAIGGQNGHLHNIGGNWYKFKAGKVRRRDSAKYETVYTWLFDPGVPSIPPGLDPESGEIAVDPPRFLVSSLGIQADPPQFGWTRPPYETIRVRTVNTIDETKGVQDQHKFYSFLGCVIEGQGFKKLPGNPL